MFAAKDFYRKVKYNCETQNQLWMSQIADSHDNHCSCECPFAHLLASIFPPGHKDRDLTINQILLRDFKQLCRSGGEEEERTGMAETSPTDLENIKEEAGAALPEEEDGVEQLLIAAAAAAEEEDER